MKHSKYIVAGLFALVYTTVGLLAQDSKTYVEPLRSFDGSPDGQLYGQKGSLVRDMSSNRIWMKTTSDGKSGWTSLSADALGGAVIVSGTLAAGTLTITNTAITTNTKAFVQGLGTSPNAVLTIVVGTGTAVVTSGTNTDTRVFNAMLYNGAN